MTQRRPARKKGFFDRLHTYVTKFGGILGAMLAVVIVVAGMGAVSGLNLLWSTFHAFGNHDAVGMQNVFIGAGVLIQTTVAFWLVTHMPALIAALATQDDRLTNIETALPEVRNAVMQIADHAQYICVKDVDYLWQGLEYLVSLYPASLSEVPQWQKINGRVVAAADLDRIAARFVYRLDGNSSFKKWTVAFCIPVLTGAPFEEKIVERAAKFVLAIETAIEEIQTRGGDADLSVLDIVRVRELRVMDEATFIAIKRSLVGQPQRVVMKYATMPPSTIVSDADEMFVDIFSSPAKLDLEQRKIDRACRDADHISYDELKALIAPYLPAQMPQVRRRGDSNDIVAFDDHIRIVKKKRI